MKNLKSRNVELDNYRIISLLPIISYHEIAHVFCSTGDLSVLLGKIIYRGRLIALDILKENISETKKKFKNSRLSNVEAVHMSEGSLLKLQDSSLDGTMISYSLRMSDNVNEILRETNRFLKNGGWLSLIEEYPVKDGDITFDEYKNIAEKAGFHFYMKHNLSVNVYMMLLRK
jgi:ubiquinone/menaquinone biosynthesis C-methylase UbiE|tara:strand:+ start:130 stop:648 length:519 start_codon:yes stop_codon:yes gene_type:complete